MILSSFGCGYAFTGSGSILPPDVKKIYIPIVENNTTDSTLSNVLTESLQDHFEQYGAVAVVDSVAEADAVLRVKVLKIKKGSDTTTSKTDTTLQQNTVLTVGAELRRTSGPLLWKNPQFNVSQSYGTTAGSILTSSSSFAGGGLTASDLASLDSRELSRGQEEEALATMADAVAAKIYNDAVAPDF